MATHTGVQFFRGHGVDVFSMQRIKASLLREQNAAAAAAAKTSRRPQT